MGYTVMQWRENWYLHVSSVRLPYILQSLSHALCFRNGSIHYTEQVPDDAKAKLHFGEITAEHICDLGQDTVVRGNSSSPSKQICKFDLIDKNRCHQRPKRPLIHISVIQHKYEKSNMRHKIFISWQFMTKKNHLGNKIFKGRRPSNSSYQN